MITQFIHQLTSKLSKMGRRHNARPSERLKLPRKQVIRVSDVEINHASISRNAIKVLETLHKHGYEAYIVGGAVRDLLIGTKPKDFDVATNADPQQIKALFRRSRI